MDSNSGLSLLALCHLLESLSAEEVHVYTTEGFENRSRKGHEYGQNQWWV